MSTLMNYIDFKHLIDNSNTNYIEVVADSIYKYARDAIANNRVREVNEEFLKISKEFERFGNSINLDESMIKRAYCFGKITALSRLITDLSKALNTIASYESLFHDYPKLKSVLKEISMESDISGVKLRKRLGMSPSALANFIHRISDYHLIIVHKVGKTNYYSLSHEGRKALAVPDGVNDFSRVDPSMVVYMVKMLDSISEEMRKEEPNSITVLNSTSLHELDIRDKSILRVKIDAVFSSRDAHFRNMFSSAVRVHVLDTSDEMKVLPYSAERVGNVYSYQGTY